MSETHTRPRPTVALPTFPQGVPLAWAVLCGAVSAVGVRWTWPLAGRLLAAVLLAEFVWRWVVWLLVQGEGQRPPAASRAPLFTLPYAQPNSPARRFTAWLSGALRVLWSVWVSPRGLRARTVGALVLVGLFLSLGLGAPAAWVGALILALALAAGFGLRASPAAEVWAPGALVALAWVVGATTAAGQVSLHLVVAPAYGLAASGLAALDRGLAWGRGIFLAGIIAPVPALVAFRLALPATLLAFVAVAACATLLPSPSATPGLARAARPLLWVSMAGAALALGL
ncbi:MAG: hypothetical protein H5T65_12695 [Chloroflexi bacterium]|nr:hypothetical protein [Chloroflexota bacterium]